MVQRHILGVKGEETYLFPYRKPFNNRHKTQPLNPVLEFNGCVLFLVIHAQDDQGRECQRRRGNLRL